MRAHTAEERRCTKVGEGVGHAGGGLSIDLGVLLLLAEALPLVRVEQVLHLARQVVVAHHHALEEVRHFLFDENKLSVKRHKKTMTSRHDVMHEGLGRGTLTGLAFLGGVEAEGVSAAMATTASASRSTAKHQAAWRPRCRVAAMVGSVVGRYWCWLVLEVVCCGCVLLSGLLAREGIKGTEVVDG
jgi:hypothetical protein